MRCTGPSSPSRIFRAVLTGVDGKPEARIAAQWQMTGVGPKLLPGNAGNSRPSRRSRRTAQPPTGTVGYVDDDMNVETASGQPVPFTNDRSAKNDALLERALTPEGCRCARRGLVASGKMMRGRRAFPLGRAALYPQPCPRETQTPRARVRLALSWIRTSMFSDNSDSEPIRRKAALRGRQILFDLERVFHTEGGT